MMDVMFCEAVGISTIVNIELITVVTPSSFVVSVFCVQAAGEFSARK